MYKIELPKRITKQLDKVPKEDYPSVSKAIQNLKETPRPIGCKKLSESLYRIRIGDYRIIYMIEKNDIKVISLVKREVGYSRLE